MEVTFHHPLQKAVTPSAPPALSPVSEVQYATRYESVEPGGIYTPAREREEGEPGEARVVYSPARSPSSAQKVYSSIMYGSPSNPKTSAYDISLAEEHSISETLQEVIKETSDAKMSSEKAGAWKSIEKAIAARSVKRLVEAVDEIGEEAIQGFKLGKTLLHIAAELEIPEIVDKLIELGLNPCAETPKGQNPLHIAAEKGNIKVMKSFIKFFKDNKLGLNITDNEGNTALHYAAKAGKHESASLLIEEGADYGICNIKHMIPLHIAAEKGHVEVVKAIPGSVGVQLRGGTIEPVDTVNRLYPSGYNAIHFAAKEGHRDTLAELVKKGGDINRYTKDKIPDRPIELALRNNHQSTVVFLYEHGAIVKGIKFSTWGIKSTIAADLESHGAVGSVCAIL